MSQLFDWLMGRMSLRDVWSYACVESGGQCAVFLHFSGAPEMLKWCADNLENWQTVSGPVPLTFVRSMQLPLPSDIKKDLC